MSFLTLVFVELVIEPNNVCIVNYTLYCSRKVEMFKKNSYKICKKYDIHKK